MGWGEDTSLNPKYSSRRQAIKLALSWKTEKEAQRALTSLKNPYARFLAARYLANHAKHSPYRSHHQAMYISHKAAKCDQRLRKILESELSNHAN